MATYRLFPSTSGPAAGVSYGAVTVQTTKFELTSPNLWLEGYYIWSGATNSNSGTVDFALWAANGAEAGVICSSGCELTENPSWVAGAWNGPFLLAVPQYTVPGVAYAGGYDLTGNFPTTNAQFHTGGVYSAGLTSGPITAYSDNTGTAADPWGDAQCAVATSGGITSVYPTGAGGSAGFNCWVDFLFTDQAPSSGTYWPFANHPAVSVYGNTSPDSYTLGWEHYTTQACPAERVWHYSPPGLTGGLPTWAGIWDVTSTSIVWQNNSPTWSGSAGSGWVSTPVTGFTSTANALLRGSTFLNAGAETWFTAQANYYSSGPGASGFTVGPLVVPTTNSWYNAGSSLAYPNTTSPESDFSGIVEYGQPVVATAPVMYQMRFMP